MTTHVSPQAKDWSPARESDAGNVQGVIGYVPASTFTIAQNDIIQMAKMPIGATVMDCFFESGALTGVSIIVGDDGDTNRYISSTSHNTAALTRRNQTDTVGVPYTYSAANTIDLAMTGANPPDNVAFALYLLYICGVDTTP